MRFHILLLCFVFGSVCLARQATSVDKDALRQALPAPKLEISLWNITSNLVSDVNPVEIPARIAALRKQLRGTYRDAGVLLEIYDLQSKLNDADDNLLRRAVALAKMRTEKAPQDAEAWVHLGEAYVGLQRYSEAESALRRAIRLNSRSWKAWLKLGDALQWQAVRAITNASGVLTESAGQRDTSPSPEQLQKASRGLRRMVELMKQAEECINKAASLAPREPEVYHSRLSIHMAGSILSIGLLAQRDGENPQIPDLLTPEVRDDLTKLESLQPDNPTVQAMRIFFWLFRRIFTSGEEGVDWEKLPPAARADYQKGVANLERISRSADRRKATWALRHLASAHFFIRQFRELGIADLRRAISLAPQEMENYEMLAAYLVVTGRKEEAIAECERWLKVKDNARAHVILSKLLYEKGQVEEAKEHARAALRLALRDMDANLLLAAYLLKEGEDLAQAQRLLDAIAPQMRESVPKEKRAQYLMQRGVLLALQDNLAGARWAIARARELQPDSEQAETLWKLLNPEKSS